MNNLFVKFLPGEGQIKELDIVFKDNEKGTVVHVYPNGEAYEIEFSYGTATYPKHRVKKAIPHLCSLDIKVGDKPSCLQKGEIITLPDPITKSQLQYLNKDVWFMKLGMISPDANWITDGIIVKEGEYFPYHKHDENGKLYYTNQYGDPTDIPVYVLMCPTCKHFH